MRESSPDPRGQRISASRDAYTAGGDLHIHLPPESVEGTAVERPAADRTAARGVMPPPFGRLPERIRGREELVRELSGLRGDSDGRTQVLVGLGGTGKSTIALQLCDEAVRLGRPVWWVTGVDGATLTSSLLILAQELGASPSDVEAALAGRRDPSDVLWRQLEERSGWMLVLDNLDDVLALRSGERQARDGNGWLRPTRAGTVLVTSRDTDAAAWGRGVRLHTVGWLDEASGSEMLLDLAPRCGPREEAARLSRRLGGLPLALYQAGSYLSSGFARERTFSAYRAAVDSRFGTLLGDTENPRDSLTGTWAISLEQLAARGLPHASDLLAAVSWFAGSVAVPDRLLDLDILRALCPERGPEGVAAGLRALLAMGLIGDGTGPDSEGVVLHPLVAEAMRLLTDAEQHTAGVAVDLMRNAIRPLDPLSPRDWPVWTALLPHLDELLRHAAQELGPGTLSVLAETCRLFVRAQVWRGFYQSSDQLAVRSLEAVAQLSAVHPSVVGLRYERGVSLRFRGRYAEAEPVFREVLADQLRIFGSEDADTLFTRHELARCAAEQGRLTEARTGYEALLPVWTDTQGPDHPGGFFTQQELARTLCELGLPDQAEELYRDLLSRQSEVLGPEHPNTLTTHYRIAETLAARGRVHEAEALFQEVLQARLRLLGPAHPNTLYTRYAIAELRGSTGDTAEAERAHTEVLSAQTEALGPTHPDTLTTRYALASLALRRGDRPTAHQALTSLLPLQIEALGPTHPATERTRAALSSLDSL